MTEQVGAALEVLSKNPSGFFLMVESGMIDRCTHLLDMERAVYDTIMLEGMRSLARDWAAAHGDDTLILVITDHDRPNGLLGTIDDDMTKEARLRCASAYAYTSVPDCQLSAPDAEGYPARIGRQPPPRLVLGQPPRPLRETLRPSSTTRTSPRWQARTPTPTSPTNATSIPGAALRLGNLPAMINADVRSGEDVILTATGPGSERVRGQMDDAEVFRVIAEALGLGAPDASEPKRTEVVPRQQSALHDDLSQRRRARACPAWRQAVTRLHAGPPVVAKRGVFCALPSYACCRRFRSVRCRRMPPRPQQQRSNSRPGDCRACNLERRHAADEEVLRPPGPGPFPCHRQPWFSRRCRPAPAWRFRTFPSI